MLNVIICEDDLKQRTRLEKIINKYILLDDYHMGIVCSATSPGELLEYLNSNPSERGLYFLDVNLQSDINGIELGSKIRELDLSCTIVFITTHAELAHLVFQHKVSALDYIIKDSPPEEVEARIAECMRLAQQYWLDGKHSQSKYFTVRTGDHISHVPFDDILFFETNVAVRNRLFLHKMNGKVEFRGVIKDIAELGLPFFNCTQSFVVNLDKVSDVDRTLREAKLVNGAIVPIANRKMAEFLKALGWLN